jgi:hypothetical protein
VEFDCRVPRNPPMGGHGHCPNAAARPVRNLITSRSISYMFKMSILQKRSIGGSGIVCLQDCLLLIQLPVLTGCAQVWQVQRPTFRRRERDLAALPSLSAK